MKVCRLVDVAKIDSGSGFPLQYQGMKGEEFPFLKVSDMNLPGNERSIRTWNNSISDEVRNKLRAKAFPVGTLIFPKIGAAIGTNKKRQLTLPSCVDNNVIGVIPNTELLEPEFLYFQFLAKNISDFASGSNPPSIRKSDVENWMVTIPSLAEQRRIVDILSRAEGIVRLRREAEKKAAELIPALFLDMFGDPATNPKWWQVMTLGEVIEEFRYGTSQKSGPTGFPVLRIPNIIGDRLNPIDMKFVAVSKLEADRIRLHNGDLLFVRTNGNPDYVGRSAVFESEVIGQAGFDGDNTLYASYLIRARIRRKLVEPLFLQAYLSSAEGKRKLRERCRTSAGQFNINTNGLASVPVPVPNLEMQSDFIKRYRDVLGIQSQQSAATAKAQATFDALLAQVFA